MLTHELKVWHAYFREIARGEKTLEIRFGDDRQYAVGDLIRFREWEHGALAYTGRWLTARIAQCERTDPARFGVYGQPVWALELTEVGAVQEGIVPSAVPVRIDLGLAPEGTTTFDGWEAWPTWIPVGAAHIEEYTGAVRGDLKRAITLCRIPGGEADGAMIAWVKMSAHAAYEGRTCVLRMRRGAVEGPQDVTTIPLTHACVVRTKPGTGCDLFTEVEILGIVPQVVP
jgi:hypothetical protein